MSIDIHCPGGLPFSAVKHLGVVIKQIGPGARHIGILYQKVEGEPMVLHLAWHRILCNDSPKPSYSWLQSSIDDLNREALAEALAKMSETDVGFIGYSPIYTGTYFSLPGLNYTRSEPGDGLTCATFVMEIFRTFGFELLQTSTWLARYDDSSWRDSILSDLQQYSGTEPGIEEHITAIREQPPSVRFRPEEVAAGAGSSEAPLCFNDAVRIGECILGVVVS